jgi:hypothetical protein
MNTVSILATTAIFEMLHGTFWVIAIKRRDEARSFNRQTA